MQTSLTYHYYFSYDEIKDEFFAFIDDGTKKGNIIFSIETTKEVCDYIKTGVMNHIDDTEGLEAFLKRQEIIQANDVLLLSEKPLW